MKTKEQIALQEQESESIKISGAEAVIRCLLAEGVDLIYGYPGGATCLFMTNCISSRSIESRID